MPKYRIGDFARELGVTPDFLKYCEKQGYITPHTEPNGYRYYDFEDAALMIEYIKLKNQGFSAKDINKSLRESSFAECVARLESQREDIERQLVFRRALLAYCDQLASIRDAFRDPPVWHIRRSEGFYFLPHSIGHEFIPDEQTRQAVRAWVPYLPIVMSARRLSIDGSRQTAPGNDLISWGFSVNEHFARQIQLPVSPPVLHIPPTRCLEVFMFRELANLPKTYLCTAREILARNGLVPSGDAYAMVISKLWENGVRNEYSVLVVPLRD